MTVPPPPKTPVRAGKPSVPPPPEDPDEFRMPLIEHLKELKNRLLWALAAVGVGVAISFFFTDQILEWLTTPIRDALRESGVEGGLVINSAFEGVQVWMKVAILSGLLLGSPVVAWQIWAFVAPGLYSQERRTVAPLAFSSTVLFSSGALFCYYVVLPRAFPFLLQVIDVTSNLSIEAYLGTMINMMLAFGACFQLPVITWFLARLGLIDHRDMIKFFRYAIVAIFVVSAVITPDPSVITQSMLAVPLTLLYCISIGIAYVATTKGKELTEET